MIRRVAVVIALAMIASGAIAAPALAGDEVAVVIEVAVKVEDGADAASVAAEEDGFLLETLIESRNVHLLGKVEFVDVKDIEKKTDDEAEKWAKDLEKVDGVAWAEPVWIEESEDLRFHAWPDDEYVTTPDLDNAAMFEYLGLDAAHETSTGAGVVVAVLDTGIDATHPLLTGRVLPGFDLVGDDADPSEEGDGLDNDGDGIADEAYGHGTFVAGVVAQVAPGATILPIRVLDADGRAEIPTVVDAIYLAIESGADVINLSFGLQSDEKPDSLKDALKAAKDEGILVVAAAGNTGNDDKRYPASESSVIGVGALAVEDDSEVAGFSSHGKWVLLAAPGVGIVSSVPGGGYATWAGTSMAAPVVAGQAAILLEIDPEAKRNDVEKAIKDSARKMHGDHKTEKGAVDILESIADMM